MTRKKIVLLTLVLFVASVVGSSLLFADGLTSADFMSEAKAIIKTVNVTEAKSLFDRGGYLFIDVREPNETAMGQIPGATLIPRGLLEFRIAKTVEARTPTSLSTARAADVVLWQPIPWHAWGTRTQSAWTEAGSPGQRSTIQSSSISIESYRELPQGILGQLFFCLHPAR